MKQCYKQVYVVVFFSQKHEHVVKIWSPFHFYKALLQKVANICLFSLLHSMLKFTVNFQSQKNIVSFKCLPSSLRGACESVRKIFYIGFWRNKTERKWLSLSYQESCFTDYVEWVFIDVAAIFPICVFGRNTTLCPDGGTLPFWKLMNKKAFIYSTVNIYIGPWCI